MAPPQRITSYSLEPTSVLHGKGDFANVIKVTDLKIGKLAWIIQVDSI